MYIYKIAIKNKLFELKCQSAFLHAHYTKALLKSDFKTWSFCVNVQVENKWLFLSFKLFSLFPCRRDIDLNASHLVISTICIKTHTWSTSIKIHIHCVVPSTFVLYNSQLFHIVYVSSIQAVIVKLIKSNIITEVMFQFIIQRGH